MINQIDILIDDLYKAGYKADYKLCGILDNDYCYCWHITKWDKLSDDVELQTGTRTQFITSMRNILEELEEDTTLDEKLLTNEQIARACNPSMRGVL